MTALRITLIQPDLHWEDPAANLKNLESHLAELGDPTDLIVLPEMFTTGFSMNPARCAQPMDGPVVKWMMAAAARAGAVVTGSLAVMEGGAYFNRLLWVEPDGRIQSYDKRHLFRMAGEEKVYTAGQRHLTLRIKGWLVRPFICYDLRFPIWTRNVQNGYDLALFVANWPQKRAQHWKSLLVARAIENQSYVLGVNRVGTDGNQVLYSGDSMLIDPRGEMLFQASHIACQHQAVLDPKLLAEYREVFPVWKDADHAGVNPWPL